MVEPSVCFVLKETQKEDLEEIEGVGEGEQVLGAGGWREEEFERGGILGWNGVGEAVKVVGDPSVSLSHAEIRHYCRPSSSSAVWVIRYLDLLFRSSRTFY